MACSNQGCLSIGTVHDENKTRTRIQQKQSYSSRYLYKHSQHGQLKSWATGSLGLGTGRTLDGVYCLLEVFVGKRGGREGGPQYLCRPARMLGVASSGDKATASSCISCRRHVPCVIVFYIVRCLTQVLLRDCPAFQSLLLVLTCILASLSNRPPGRQ
jgi:hypothetical protein